MLSFELSILKKFKHTITVTTNDARGFTNYFPKHDISVIPLGVDYNYFSPNSLKVSTNPSLIFTGYFLHSPNVDAVKYFVSDIFPMVKAKIPNVKFYIVGSSPTNEVLSLAKDENIVVTGWVADLRPYLQDAAVYIAPLRLGVGFRGKLLEAFAMAKPVVATTLAARGLTVKDKENIMIADSPNLFAEKIIYLLENKSESVRIGNNARKIVEENYSWQQIASQNELAIYKTLKH